MPKRDSLDLPMSAWYIEMHRIVTGLNARAVWEQILQNKTCEEICSPLPDELHGFVQEVYKTIKEEYLQKKIEILEIFNEVIISMSPIVYDSKDLESYKQIKKQFALAIKDNPLKSFLFTCFDRRHDLPLQILKTLKPAPDWRPISGAY